MEQKTTGKLLSALRKEHGYTQQQVAELLSVSNRAISKWECDDGYPETTMLLALADLYGVTVDEILRGERAENNQAEESTQKAEDNTKQFLERAYLKFKNLSIISVALGATAAMLSFIICDTIGDYYLDIITYAFIYLMTIISVVVSAIACNNYLSSFNLEETEKSVYNAARIKANFLISLNVFFVISAIEGKFSDYPLNDFVIVMIFIALLVAFVVNYLLNKRIAGEINSALRDRTAKRIFISTLIVCILSISLSFVYAYIDSEASQEYSFAYQLYSGEENTERAFVEYKNVKEYFESDKELYKLISFNENDGKCIFECYKYDYKVDKNDNGYYIESGFIEDNETVLISFNSKDEAEEFYNNHIIIADVDFLFDKAPTGISFADEEYAIKYKDGTAFKTNLYYELPVYCVTGTAICLLIFAANIIGYMVSKKRIDR